MNIIEFSDHKKQQWHTVDARDVKIAGGLELFAFALYSVGFTEVRLESGAERQTSDLLLGLPFQLPDLVTYLTLKSAGWQALTQAEVEDGKGVAFLDVNGKPSPPLRYVSKSGLEGVFDFNGFRFKAGRQVVKYPSELPF